MEIYLIDPPNVYFSRNIEYILYAYPVYTYSCNQLLDIVISPCFILNNHLVIIIMHIYIIIISVLFLLFKTIAMNSI